MSSACQRFSIISYEMSSREKVLRRPNIVAVTEEGAELSPNARSANARFWGYPAFVPPPLWGRVTSWNFCFETSGCSGMRKTWETDFLPLLALTRRGAAPVKTNTLSFLSLLFWNSLFFPVRRIPCFLERFSLLFQGFKGFGRDKKSLFFWWFSLPFSKKTRKGRTGYWPIFARHFLRKFLLFFCGVIPFKTLAAPQPLNIAFPLGNGGVLRSEEGGGFRKEGDGGEGEKKRKKGRAKSAQNTVVIIFLEKNRDFPKIIIGRREKTPTPKTRSSIWTLLRTPGRFTTRPLPVYFTTKMSVVRPFSVLSKDEIGPW